uniref:Uncharacterized protein n=1 Tax=Panagrellus redivivus TaxID=6233 RepID=A0A7E4VBC8_PANRE
MLDFMMLDGVLTVTETVPRKSCKTIEISHDDLFFCNGNVIFDNMKIADLEAPQFVHFMLHPTSIQFEKCDDSPAFYQRISALTNFGAIQLTINNTSKICFKTIFKAFPNTTNMWLSTRLPDGWMTEIAQHQKTMLTKLAVLGKGTIGAFTSSEIDLLLKRQSKQFKMGLTLFEPTPLLIKRVESELDRSLKRMNPEENGRVFLIHNGVIVVYE